MKFTVEEFLSRLPLPANEKWPDGVRDIELFEKNGVTLVFFAPRSVDRQTNHDRDEFYFIASGKGEILIGGTRHDFETGDAFFVPAHIDHRFENFSDDFSTWAIFF